MTDRTENDVAIAAIAMVGIVAVVCILTVAITIMRVRGVL